MGRCQVLLSSSVSARGGRPLMFCVDFRQGCQEDGAYKSESGDWMMVPDLCSGSRVDVDWRSECNPCLTRRWLRRCRRRCPCRRCLRRVSRERRIRIECAKYERVCECGYVCACVRACRQGASAGRQAGRRGGKMAVLCVRPSRWTPHSLTTQPAVMRAPGRARADGG